MNRDNHNLICALAAFLVTGLAGFAFSGGLTEIDAERNYLEDLRIGIHLAARNCSRGIEVGGDRPVASCVDVAFTAYCPGSIVGTKGVLRNFTGLDAACSGDTIPMGEPACKAEELRVVVDEVRPCGK